MVRFMSTVTLLVLASLAGAMAGPQITDAQATAIASAFCSQVGVAVNASATARHRATPGLHWQPRWEVTFGKQAVVEVVEATRSVSYYENVAFNSQHPSLRPMAPPISEAAAVHIAKAVLHSTGDTSELVFSGATLQQPEATAMGFWLVSWKRQFRGLPYRGQQANVLLDAATGTVKYLCKTFPTPPPAVHAVRISAGQASSQARKILDAAGRRTVGPARSVVTMVVVPNNRWGVRGTEAPITTMPRVSWVCRFMVGTVLHEAWVDAESGADNGGSVSTYRGRSDSRAPLSRSR